VNRADLLCIVTMLHLILASQSPRRRELIRLLNYPFSSMAANADEESITHPNPAANVVHTAQLKAAIIAAQLPPPQAPTMIVAADTCVTLDGQMLNKPADEADARRMLTALRGREHEVHTGVVLLDPASGQTVTAVHTAIVTMRAYSDVEISAYVATQDPLDKAGAYAIQHPVFAPVARLDGCYLGVVGLSVCQLLTLLAQFNVPLRADLDAATAAHKGFPCPLLADLRAA